MTAPERIAVCLSDADGTRHELVVAVAQSLMRAAVSAGIDGIKADCGGMLSCATCHVIVDAAWAARLPAPSPDEEAMLEMTAAPRQPTSRLSCQIALDETLDGLTATLPQTQY
ncbi:MAG: 2Fe-2S iron-sulfur cluster-binding protein [Caldimonas sp.]